MKVLTKEIGLMGKEYKDRDERVKYLWKQVRMIYYMNTFIIRLKRGVSKTYQINLEGITEKK